MDDNQAPETFSSRASLPKKPKGILKNSTSFDTPDNSTPPSQHKASKETKWDEMNIIATLHPADKDYGHMKIDEPKTPYNYDMAEDGMVASTSASGNSTTLNPSDLAERIRQGASELPKALKPTEADTSSSDSDLELTPEERAKRREFRHRRKNHYNEFRAVQMARKLLEEEEGDEEDDDDVGAPTSAVTDPSAAGSRMCKHRPSGEELLEQIERSGVLRTMRDKSPKRADSKSPKK